MYPMYLRSSASVVEEGGGLGKEQKGRGAKGRAAAEPVAEGGLKGWWRWRTDWRERLRLLARSICEFKVGF